MITGGPSKEAAPDYCPKSMSNLSRVPVHATESGRISRICDLWHTCKEQELEAMLTAAGQGEAQALV